MRIDILIDYETAGGEDHTRNQSAVLDLSAVAFVHNPDSGELPDFNQMIENGFNTKFDLRSQKGVRIIDRGTLGWWKKQSPEAQKILLPSDKDVTVEVGHRRFATWIEEQGLTRQSKIWCRGNSFDFPILAHCLHQSGIPANLMGGFWNQRDIRTRIETLLGDDITDCPLPKDAIPGFIAHNSLHDCAKDVMSLFYAYRYAFGMQGIPEIDDCHPSTVKKPR